MLNAVLKKWFAKNNSKDEAKKRLQFALVYDRLEVSDEVLTNLQSEIVDVISKYFVIDRKKLKLEFTRGSDLSALVLNTPILSSRSR